MARALGRVAFVLGLGVAAAIEQEEGSRWAVIAAGSAGYGNYRHQADACHAYQVLRKGGIPASNIILMMQDDVANSDENPFPGQLFNKPGNDSVDVYEGCKIDYRGDIVTADLFVKVITGDDSDLPKGGSGKVLKSKAIDQVFLNFADHGGVGIVAFPNGPLLSAKELSKALKTMQAKNMFKELVFYMEACESGSMFPDLTKDGKILAVTAANAQESSWGTYCMPTDVVKGKELNTCLGDLFSVNWMEDSDLGHWSGETIGEQIEKVTKLTNKSHVLTFGDLSLEKNTIGSFELRHTLEAPVKPMHRGAPFSVRDIPLHTAYWRWARAESHKKAEEFDTMQRIVANRHADEVLFNAFAQKACNNFLGCSIASAKMELNDYECHQALATIVQESCPRREAHNSGGWNGFNMQFSQVLVNACESKALLKKDTHDLEDILYGECAGASLEAAQPQQKPIIV